MIKRGAAASNVSPCSACASFKAVCISLKSRQDGESASDTRGIKPFDGAHPSSQPDGSSVASRDDSQPGSGLLSTINITKDKGPNAFLVLNKCSGFHPNRWFNCVEIVGTNRDSELVS